MNSVIKFIEEHLFLKVNRDKTSVVYFNRIKFLVYSFYKIKGEMRFRIHPKSVVKLKAKLKVLTSRSKGWGNEKRKSKLSSFIKGWLNYYKYADMLKLMERIDAWYRRRLRMVIWKQWKKIKTKCRNLTKFGIDKYKAWEYANTRKSYRRTSRSPILQRSVTSERLKRAGYIFFTDYYKQVRV